MATRKPNGGMKHIGLFEGFGGFSLAARWAGWSTVATCEIAKHPRRVISHHFPKAYHHEDIHDFNYGTVNDNISERFGEHWRDEKLIITGGFPCQPYSISGKRKGKEDDRHLWPQMLRVIQEFTPDWVVGENVSGIISWNGGLVFEEVQVDLEAEGYEVWPVVLPAASVNAPHRRDRVWFIAHASSDRRQREGQGLEIKDRESRPGSSRLLERGSEGLCSLRNATNPDIDIGHERGMHQKGSEEAKRHLSTLDTRDGRGAWQNFPTQSPICGGNDGIPSGMVLNAVSYPKWRNESIKGYGNAIVPQVAYEIFKVINKIEKLKRSK